MYGFIVALAVPVPRALHRYLPSQACHTFERFTDICPQNDEKRDIAPNAFKCPQMHVESISMRKKRKKTSF